MWLTPAARVSPMWLYSIDYVPSELLLSEYSHCFLLMEMFPYQHVLHGILILGETHLGLLSNLRGPQLLVSTGSTSLQALH